MTGPEHYREAESTLQQVVALLYELEIGTSEQRHAQIVVEVPLHLGYAQVHATLALAAATGTRGVVEPGSGDRSPADDEAWYEAAGVRG